MNKQTIKFETVNDDGEEVEYELAAKYEICPRCEGSGSHTNPSIDSHGITSEEWERDWDDESREMYFNGGYDVTCYECKGERVVLEVDEEQINNYGTPEQKKMLEEYWNGIKADREYEAMCRAERRFGC